jgi:hypothetical protein
MSNEPGSIEDTDSIKDTHGMPFEPLHISVPAPYRRPVDRLPGRRRPVVAILDTGVAAEHDWFKGPDGDPVLVDAGKFDWTNDGGTSNWHGTFVAGLIRHGAPDARILSLSLRRAGVGRIASGELNRGLKWLLKHTSPTPHHMPLPGTLGFVDVVCLAVGFRLGPPDDLAYAKRLGRKIRALHARGTVVLAAAGNLPPEIPDPADPYPMYPGPVYPAALAGRSNPPPLIVVGAKTTADGSELADFSESADWVTYWYAGVDVLSVTPVVVPSAELVQDYMDQTASAITTDYIGEYTNFGRGSGTSYAVAGLAGKVAQATLDGPDAVRDVLRAAERPVQAAVSVAGGPA